MTVATRFVVCISEFTHSAKPLFIFQLNHARIPLLLFQRYPIAPFISVEPLALTSSSTLRDDGAQPSSLSMNTIDRPLPSYDTPRKVPGTYGPWTPLVYSVCRWRKPHAWSKGTSVYSHVGNLQQSLTDLVKCISNQLYDVEFMEDYGGIREITSATGMIRRPHRSSPLLFSKDYLHVPPTISQNCPWCKNPSTRTWIWYVYLDRILP